MSETEQQLRKFLKEHGIPFDRILQTKPPAAFIVDDRAIHHTGWESTFNTIVARESMSSDRRQCECPCGCMRDADLNKGMWICRGTCHAEAEWAEKGGYARYQFLKQRIGQELQTVISIAQVKTLREKHE